MLMESNDIFNLLHNACEAANNGKKISHKAMAEKLGIPMRTYQDWRIGTAKPYAAKAILTMLGMLEEDEMIHVIKRITKKLNTVNEGKKQ